MQPTNFSKYLTNFLTKYLSHERGASPNTVGSYRDSFVLLIIFMESIGVKLNKLTLEKITKDVIISFLEWIQVVRKNRDAKGNSRQ